MNFLITRKLGDIISNDAPFDFIEENSFLIGAEIMLSKPELIDDVDLSEIKRKCEGLKLTAHLPFYDLNIASVDSFIRSYSMDVMIKGLVFCEKLDIRSAIAHFGFNVKLAGKAAAKWKETFFPQKKLIEGEAQKRGVNLIWENTYENNIEFFDEILKVCPDTRFCLDSGHCNCFADFSPVEFINRYKEKVVHLHLHDNDGKEDSHMSPGLGSVNFSALFNEIGKSKIENTVFEIEPEMYMKNKNNISEIFKTRKK